MSDLEDKLERIEKVLSYTCRMVKRLRRAHNNVTKVFDENFEVFEVDVKRNSANIDKIVNTLEALMGEDGELKKLPERKEDEYTQRLYQ